MVSSSLFSEQEETKISGDTDTLIEEIVTLRSERDKAIKELTKRATTLNMKERKDITETRFLKETANDLRSELKRLRKETKKILTQVSF